jgi:hypothetical protein
MKPNAHISNKVKPATKSQQITEKTQISLEAIKSASSSDSFSKRNTCQRRS